MDKRQNDKRVKWVEVVFDSGTERHRKKGDSLGQSQLVETLRGIDPCQLGAGHGPRMQTRSNNTAELHKFGYQAIDIVYHFVRRWRVEVTYAEVRRPQGVETQRQWSDLAIERSTSLLLDYKLRVCLLALPLVAAGKINMQATAWYAKRRTF